MKKYSITTGLIISLFLTGALFIKARSADWRTADRSSAGITPLPEDFKGTIIQVYAARTYGWRGTLAVHTWITTKNKNATTYVVHQVLGWRKRRHLPVLFSAPDVPDRMWFDNRPELLVDIRGPAADELLDRVLAAIAEYPFKDKYTMWPGPNSNTFTAFVGRQVPELKLNLPPTAIGKDYLPDDKIYATAPSGTGHQLSLYGLAGIMVSAEEGVEVNVLGLNFGFNPGKPALRLPGVGIVGAD